MTQSPIGPAAFESGASRIDSTAPLADQGGRHAHDVDAVPAQGGDAEVAHVGAVRPRPSRRLPGGRVVLVATLVIITVAMFEVIERERIGLWTGATLLAISAIAVLVTRPGDRSLPAMMPPLAFLTAVVIAGQQLLNSSIDDTRQREAVMIVETLGENAAWVVAATAVAVLMALIGHLVSRRSRRRAAEAGGQVPQG